MCNNVLTLNRHGYYNEHAALMASQTLTCVAVERSVV